MSLRVVRFEIDVRIICGLREAPSDVDAVIFNFGQVFGKVSACGCAECDEIVFVRLFPNLRGVVR